MVLAELDNEECKSFQNITSDGPQLPKNILKSV